MFNLTLFVQIINFLVAYYLLSRFLFKPAVAQIERRAQYVANLQARHDQRAQDLELLSQQQQVVAQEAGLLFAPILQTIQAASRFETFEGPRLQPIKLSQATLTRIETEVTKQVVQQVQHV